MDNWSGVPRKYERSERQGVVEKGLGESKRNLDTQAVNQVASVIIDLTRV